MNAFQLLIKTATREVSAMFPFTRNKEDDDDDMDISTMMTPTACQWSLTNSPTTNEQCFNLHMTETTHKAFGRFHSFDAKRNLFDCKRAVQSPPLISSILSPVSKSLKYAETDICDISLEDDLLKQSLHKLSIDDNVIADGSRHYTLPTITGKHPDLRTITPETMADVLNGKYNQKIDQVTIIDSRYPYEFDGGHIVGSCNLYTRESIQNLLQQHIHEETHKKHVLIFHCEFSAERAPKLYRYLRNGDRALNKDKYPSLIFPEIYLLDGGYKTFFNQFKTFCTPMSYTPMLHEDYAKELRLFRVKSKSWTAGEKQPSQTPTTRLGLRF